MNIRELPGRFASRRPRFTLRGRTRRIAEALVAAMAPQWPELDGERQRSLERAILADLELLMNHWPWAYRVVAQLGLWGLELGGPLMLAGARPLTWLSPEARVQRLERIEGGRVLLWKDLLQLYTTLIALSAYGQPAVEAHIGVERRRWRVNRAEFRRCLVEEDQHRSATPPTPEALGSEGVAPPDQYLEVKS